MQLLRLGVFSVRRTFAFLSTYRVMGQSLTHSGRSEVDTGMAEQFVDSLLDKHRVVVFSKSYCPYCKMANRILSEIGAQFEIIQIEDRSDCDAIQDYLLKKTGARSVPRVFINKVCIGGGTETKSLKDQGKLVPMLKDAGAL